MSDRAVMDALRAALDERAVGHADVARVETGVTVEYRVGGHAVVVAGPGGVAFRVGPAVAAAAVRTPGAGASRRGPGWVELTPSGLDRFTLDRAAAWFDLAVRSSASTEPLPD